MAFFIGKDIAINCWTEIPNVENYFHFYTHVNSHLAPAPAGLFDKIKPVYTSSFIAWYIVTYLGVPKDVFKTIEFGVEHELHKNGKEVTFEFVTSSSLKPCFMILFKNEMGDELFAGNCKLSTEVLSVRSMLPYRSDKRLKKLYFDGSYMNRPRIPSSDHIMDSIITTIKSHKRKIVYISANILGKENILSKIARTIKKKIYVCPEKYGILQKFRLGKYFTTDPTTTYFRAVDYSQISISKISRRNKLLGPSITIVLSLKAFLANYEHREDFQRNGIFFFPLTSKNTPSELQFLKQILTREYVLTNQLTHKSNGSSSSNECCLSQNEISHSCNRFRLKRFSKRKTSAAKIVKELKKCAPKYWMSWDEYLKWRRDNLVHTL